MESQGLCIVDPKAIAKAIMLAGWPGAATAAAPTVGTMASQASTVPLNNIEVLADAVSTAAIAASAETPGIPVDSCTITVNGVGQDEVLARLKE